jgi:hypothetical protein
VWKARVGDYRVLLDIPKGKTPPGRPRRKWECNTKIDSGIGRLGLN